MKAQKNYSDLLDTVYSIKENNPDIAGENLQRAVLKNGWKLSDFIRIFYDVQDMKNFFLVQ